MTLHKDLPYINHILDAIKDIEESIKDKTKNEFAMNKDLKDANIRRLEIIGEAIKNVSNKIKENYPNVEWKKIAGTRDVIIHQYFAIDLNLVWKIIKEDLPVFKKQIYRVEKDLNKTE